MPRYCSCDQVVVAQVFRRAVAPVAAGLLVQPFGKGLGQPVGQGLDHDRIVVVVLGLEAGGQFVGADARGDGKRAEVVRPGRESRGATKSASARKCSWPLRSHCWRSVWKRASSLLARASSSEQRRCRRRRRRPARSRRRRRPRSQRCSMISVAAAAGRRRTDVAGRRAHGRIVEDRRDTCPSAPRP